jgi:hypothetical protein
VGQDVILEIKACMMLSAGTVDTMIYAHNGLLDLLIPIFFAFRTKAVILHMTLNDCKIPSRTIGKFDPEGTRNIDDALAGDANQVVMRSGIRVIALLVRINCQFKNASLFLKD